MARLTNETIYEFLEKFRQESSTQREGILGKVAELSERVAIQNGRVGFLEKTTEIHSGKIWAHDKAYWKFAGAAGLLVGGIEIAARIIFK